MALAWRHHRIWIIAVLLLSGLALAWAIAQTPMPAAPAEQMATTTPDLAGSSIYTNGEYGFAIVYPADAQLVDEGMRPWRITVWAESTGTPLLLIQTYTTSSESSYPRSYATEVSIGVSTDARGVAACERVTPDRGETALPEVSFGGATWHAFSFQEAAMHRYMRGVSYRTVHDGVCYAVEKIASGSSYREDPPSANDIPQEVLDAEYAKLDEIVMSFSFAR